MLPGLDQQLWRPHHLEWREELRLVWLEGSRHFLAFSARKRPQPQLSLRLPPKSEHSRYDIRQGPVLGGCPQSRPRQRRNHAIQPRP